MVTVLKKVQSLLESMVVERGRGIRKLDAMRLKRQTASGTKCVSPPDCRASNAPNASSRGRPFKGGVEDV